MKKKMMILMAALLLLVSCSAASAGKGDTPEGRGRAEGEKGRIYAAGTAQLIGTKDADRSAGQTVSDSLYPLQWALSNGGSFQGETRQEPELAYGAPFGGPAVPGIPGRPSSWRGFAGQTAGTELQQIRAVAGIDINAEAAWAVYAGGSRDVVVAFIDTGIDDTHEDLADILWINTGEIDGNGIDDDGNGYTDDIHGWNFYGNNARIFTGSEDSHGTHGAGTVAAASNNGTGISGIVNSEHVRIMALKALGGSSGSGATAHIVEAIRYAEANGAAICNLSLGSATDDRTLYRAIAESSMLFIVAAGNGGADTDRYPSYPASYGLDNIIAVANLNYDGTLHASSNYGASSVDLAAPGTQILSTAADNGYGYMTGTSMAAPMVTAAAAMVYSHYDSITLADVKEILLTSAKELDTLSGRLLTGGMLDLGAAMTYPLEQLTGKVWAPAEPDTAEEPPVLSVSGSPPRPPRTRPGSIFFPPIPANRYPGLRF